MVCSTLTLPRARRHRGPARRVAGRTADHAGRCAMLRTTRILTSLIILRAGERRRSRLTYGSGGREQLADASTVDSQISKQYYSVRQTAPAMAEAVFVSAITRQSCGNHVKAHALTDGFPSTGDRPTPTYRSWLTRFRHREP